MNKQDLLPHQVVVDLVLLYSAFMPKLGQAAVLQNNLLIAAKNHRGEFVSLSMPIHFDGDPFDGDSNAPPRFVLRKIDSTVWKLSPSILHDKLHAYVTIVDVPESVSWGEERITAAETSMATIEDVRSLTRDARQQRITDWAKAAFGVAEATGLAQRGVRLLEEAIEAFQACGGDEEIAHKLVAYVFARPAGNVDQELGGVCVTVLALAAAAGLSADEEECREVHRVLSKPLREFSERNANKNAAGFKIPTKESP